MVFRSTGSDLVILTEETAVTGIICFVAVFMLPVEGKSFKLRRKIGAWISEAKRCLDSI